MQAYFDELKKKSSEQITNMVRCKDPEFPEGYMLFVQHDMFGDSQFPQVILPATQEAFLSFFIAHHHRRFGEINREYRLEVKEYHVGAIITAYYETPEKRHWVHGYLRSNHPIDMKLPFEMMVSSDNLSLTEEWAAETLRDRNQEDRTEGDILLWSKN